jgi:hypothetical protein
MTSLELLLLCQGVERHEKNAAEKLARAVREYLRAIGGFQAVVPLDEALPPAHGTVVSGVVVHCPKCGHATTITTTRTVPQ